MKYSTRKWTEQTSSNSQESLSPMRGNRKEPQITQNTSTGERLASLPHQDYPKAFRRVREAVLKSKTYLQ